MGKTEENCTQIIRSNTDFGSRVYLKSVKICYGKELFGARQPKGAMYGALWGKAGLANEKKVEGRAADHLL